MSHPNGTTSVPFSASKLTSMKVPFPLFGMNGLLPLKLKPLRPKRGSMVCDKGENVIGNMPLTRTPAKISRMNLPHQTHFVFPLIPILHRKQGSPHHPLPRCDKQGSRHLLLLDSSHPLGIDKLVTIPPFLPPLRLPIVLLVIAHQTVQ